MDRAFVTEYGLPDGCRIRRLNQRDGSYRWAVTCSFFGGVLNNAGEFEPDLSPSYRDDGFMSRCRFESEHAAYLAWSLFDKKKVAHG